MIGDVDRDDGITAPGPYTIFCDARVEGSIEEATSVSSPSPQRLKLVP